MPNHPTNGSNSYGEYLSGHAPVDQSPLMLTHTDIETIQNQYYQNRADALKAQFEHKLSELRYLIAQIEELLDGYDRRNPKDTP